MNFGKKLQSLRKEKGLSQEELAQELNVSRQAVSKWENSDGYPDMDKTILISRMFNVSLDYLMKDEEEITSQECYFMNHDSIEEYILFETNYIYKIGFAVALIIMSLIFPIMIKNELGAVGMFIVVAVGVMILIINGLSHEKYNLIKQKRVQMSFEDKNILKEQYSVFKRKFNISIAVGVGLIILAFAGIILLDYIYGPENDFGSIILFTCVGVAVFTFIVFGMKYSMYRFLVDNQRYISEIEKEKKSLAGIIMPLVAFIYIFIGFVFGAWHPGWIVFPVAAVIVGWLDNR